MTQQQQQPVVVILGTNASGKSSLGIRLARRFDAEIISADSRQLFRGFDLCCGKVNVAQRAEVRHHMLDVCGVGESFSVSDYQKQVYALIPEIASRGKLPMIVGGTGLYVDAVVKGYDFAEEEGDPAFRAELEEQSVEVLQGMLSPAAAERLRENRSDFFNKRRLIRVIEKERLGRPLTVQNAPRFDVLKLGVTWPKDVLAARIDERLHKRLRQGMVDEVREYLENGGDPAVMYSLGLEYKHITWYLEGRYPDEAAFSADLATAIRQFAGRQMKWFKRDKEIHWLDMAHDPDAQAAARIEAFLHES